MVATACAAFVLGPLAENPHRVGPPLRGALTGRYAARRGDFRVVNEIHEDVVVVRVIDVRHHRNAYGWRDPGEWSSGRSVARTSVWRSRKAPSSSRLRLIHEVTSAWHLLALHDRQAGTTFVTV